MDILSKGCGGIHREGREKEGGMEGGRIDGKTEGKVSE